MFTCHPWSWKQWRRGSSISKEQASCEELISWSCCFLTRPKHFIHKTYYPVTHERFTEDINPSSVDQRIWCCQLFTLVQPLAASWLLAMMNDARIIMALLLLAPSPWCLRSSGLHGDCLWQYSIITMTYDRCSHSTLTHYTIPSNIWNVSYPANQFLQEMAPF